MKALAFAEGVALVFLVVLFCMMAWRAAKERIRADVAELREQNLCKLAHADLKKGGAVATAAQVLDMLVAYGPAGVDARTLLLEVGAAIDRRLAAMTKDERKAWAKAMLEKRKHTDARCAELVTHGQGGHWPGCSCRPGAS